MVEPEGRHDFLQLARSIQRANNPRLHRFHHDDLRLAPSLLFGRRVAFQSQPDGLLEFLKKVYWSHPEGWQSIDTLLQFRWFGNRLRIELALDIRLNADATYSIVITWAWPEGEPIQNVDRPLIVGHRDCVCLFDSQWK